MDLETAKFQVAVPSALTYQSLKGKCHVFNITMTVAPFNSCQWPTAYFQVISEKHLREHSICLLQEGEALLEKTELQGHPKILPVTCEGKQPFFVNQS